MKHVRDGDTPVSPHFDLEKAFDSFGQKLPSLLDIGEHSAI